MAFAIEDGDGGGHSAVIPYHLFYRQRRFYIFGIRHAVGNDSGLQGDNRFVVVYCLLYFRVYVEVWVHAYLLL